MCFCFVKSVSRTFIDYKVIFLNHADPIRHVAAFCGNHGETVTAILNLELHQAESDFQDPCLF